MSARYQYEKQKGNQIPADPMMVRVKRDEQQRNANEHDGEGIVQCHSGRMPRNRRGGKQWIKSLRNESQPCHQDSTDSTKCGIQYDQCHRGGHEIVVKEVQLEGEPERECRGNERNQCDWF